MEKFLYILIAISIGSMAFAQVQVPGTPQWEVTLRVTDENGNPLANATAIAGYYIPPPEGATEAGSRVTLLTDTNGLATLLAHSGPSIGYSAEKEGYYSTVGAGYDFDLKNKTNGQWHPWNPWNPTLTLALKKIVNPIPMYAKWVNGGPPVFNEPVGYDLMVGDWVAPHGKGQTTDIIFNGKLDKKSKNDYDYKLTISFPKANDGIQEFSPSPVDKTSGLLSPYEAPADVYQTEVIRTMSNHPGQGMKEDMNDPKRNYFFRV
ncbi:MAG: hypothetical protein ABSD57_11445, partial [Verrucomicrobiota bacterium]